MKLNPHLKTFWKTQTQIKVLYGGRMSSKTMDTAGILAYLGIKYKLRIACLRRFQNKLSESVFSTLKRIIQEDERLRGEYTITETSIKSRVGTEFIFMGIQRNLEEIKGLDNISITWIEEAEKVTKAQWDLIRPTILRENGSFCVFVFNPNLVTDFVYKEFVVKKRENILVRKINYDENPFITENALELIEHDRQNLDEDDFNHIYMGHPKKDDNDAIIKRSWIEAAIDAHITLDIEPTGQHKIGYDIADSGDDKCAIVKTHGILAYKLSEWSAKEDELEQSAARVFKEAQKDNSNIIYDSIGVGASAGSTFKRLNTDLSGKDKKISYSKFNAGDKVRDHDKFYRDTKIKNKDMFSNLKAQAWFEIAERFKATYNAITKNDPFDEHDIISISSEIENLDQLKEELATPRKDEDNLGKVKVESKKDLSKRGIPSPNIADAFIMSYAKPKINPLLAAMEAK